MVQKYINSNQPDYLKCFITQSMPSFTHKHPHTPEIIWINHSMASYQPLIIIHKQMGHIGGHKGFRVLSRHVTADCQESNLWLSCWRMIALTTYLQLSSESI